MIFKKVRICNALSYKDTVCYVSKLRFCRSFVVETNSITDFLPHYYRSFLTHTACHADCSHSPGLSDNHIDLIDWWLFAIDIILYIFLAGDDLFSDYF